MLPRASPASGLASRALPAWSSRIQARGTSPGAVPTFKTGADPAHRWQIAGAILREGLNPLAILDAQRFTIATVEGALAGFAQLRPLAAEQMELASMVVMPEFRNQGIGRELAAQLLRRAGGQQVLLITVSKRRRFYERCGFEEVPAGEALPWVLAVERALGTVVARIVAGERLLVMRYPPMAARGGDG